MANNEVKIKLSADGKQVRDEIKLIDRELQELGGNTTKSSRTSQRTSKPNESNSPKESSSTEKVKQESRDKVNSQLLREMTLVRKELQKFNSSNGQSNKTTSGSSIPPTSGNSSSSSPNVPSGGNGDLSSPNGLKNIVGKLAVAAISLKAVSSAWSSLSSSAQSSASGESLAYRTYGSTLAYTDYNKARKSASGLGSPYGYDYETVMSAGSSNMSKAGFTNIDNYNTDMSSLLGTSKAWGIDASSLANASGYMTSIGVTESGEQKKFADLLAESIVEAEMTGREDEQLQVLEEIAENLASRDTTVTNEQLNGSLGMYNALVDQNENLKGTRGANIVSSMQDLAASGNSSLDILAGFGTKYTGLSGQLELRKLAEENPEQYWSQVYQGVQQYGLGDDYFKKLLYDNVGSVSKAEEIMSALPEISQGTFKINDTTKGEEATKERLSNYQNSDVFTQEQYQIEKKEASDDRGNVVNNVLNPLRSLYDKAPDWLKQTFDVAGWAGKNIALPTLATKGAGKLFGKVKGLFSRKGASSAGSSVAKAAGESVENIAKAAGESVDNIAKGTAESIEAASKEAAEGIAKNTTDDAVKSVLKSSGAKSTTKVLGKFGKFFGKAVGPLVSLGFGAYDYAKANSDYGRSKAVGGGVGGTIGGLIGDLLGPVGGIAGSFVGEELGKSIGGSMENGKAAYGSVFAGDWNVLGGLWRKYGTLSQQKSRKQAKSSAKSNYGGLPSDYGLPKVFDDYLTSSGDINWSGIEGALSQENNDYYRKQMESKYGMTYNELKKWESSDEYKSYQKAAEEKQARRQSLGAQSIHLKKGDAGYDASLDSSGYGYNVWTGTQDELNEWLKGQQFIGTGKSKKGDASTPYFMDELSKGDQDAIAKNFGTDKVASSNENLTSSVDTLTTEISEMRKWLEENGYKGTAAWTDESVKNKYEEEHSSSGSKNNSISNLLGGNSRTISGGLFSRFSLFNMFKSHAVGNDYIPYDNYLASLHKGEMVLNKADADDYRQGKNKSVSNAVGTLELNINLSGNINGMNSENQERITNAVIAKISSSDLQNMISNGFLRVQNY